MIGRWQDHTGGGTSEIIDSGLFKSGESIGGINALNVNTNGMDSFDIWNNVNKPWLEGAVLRGDVIRAASDPSIPSNMSNPTTFNNLSYFAMEYNYLINVANYTYDPITKLYAS